MRHLRLKYDKLKSCNYAELRAELPISCIGMILASYVRGRVVSNGKDNLKLNMKEDKLMPKCSKCGFEGPRECFQFHEGKFICIMCDFEEFLGDDANSPKSDRVVEAMLQDIANFNTERN